MGPGDDSYGVGRDPGTDIGGDTRISSWEGLPSFDDSRGRARLDRLVVGGNLGMVLFDLDGTLIHSGVPFAPFRERLGITGDVIGGIHALPEEEQEEKWEIIREYEGELERHARPAPGARKLLACLRARGIRTGVITRSTSAYARRMIRRWEFGVDASMGREDASPKPHPDGVLSLLGQFGIPAAQALMVGDFIWDILAARNARVLSVLVVMEHSRRFVGEADIVVRSLGELQGLLGGELPPGTMYARR